MAFIRLKRLKLFGRASGQSFEVFWKDAKNYLRVKMLLETLESNQSFKTEFYDKKNFSSTNMFQKTLSNSYVLTAKWSKFWSRIDRVQDSIHVILSDEPSLQKKKSLINGTFISLRENVKYMAVYPNMLTLIYLLSERDFSFSLRTIFGSFEVDSKLIAKLFFSGDLSPWFNFGNNSEPLNRYGILNSFYYALKTRTFESYGISIEDFFNRITKEIMEDPSEIIDELEYDLRVRVTGNYHSQHLLKMCEKIKDNQPYKHKITLLTLSGNAFLPERFGFDNQNESLFFSNMDRSEKYFDGRKIIEYGYIPFNYRYADWLEKLRTVYMQNMRLIYNMIEVYQSFLKEQALSNEEILLKTKPLLSRAQKYKKRRSVFIKKYKNVFLRYTNCLSLYKKLSFDNQFIFLRQEEEHLRSIYKKLKKRAEKNHFSYEKVSQFPAIDGWTGFDFIQGTNYHYHKLDAFYRTTDRIANYYSGVEVEYPISVKADYQFRGALRDREKVVLSYQKSEDEFVQQGLRALASDNHLTSPFLNWFIQSQTYHYWKDQIKMLVTLLRLSDNKQEEERWQEEIINTTKNILTNMWMSDEDIETMRKHGVTARYHTKTTNVLKGLVLSYEDQKPLGFFDKAFQYMAAHQLGAYYVEKGREIDANLVPNLHSWDEMKMISDEHKNHDYFLWSVSTEVKDISLMVGEKLFEGEVGRTRALYSRIIEEKERNKNKSNSPWRLMLDPERVSTGPFLTPSLYLGFENQVEDFHKKTGGIYRKVNESVNK